MRRLKTIGVALFLASLMVLAAEFPKLTIISGYAAKNMASTAFIAGRDPASVTANDHKVPLISLAEAAYDSAAARSSASVYGMRSRVADCRGGVGCALIVQGKGRSQSQPVPARAREAIPLPYPHGHLPPKDTLFPEVDYDQLEAAFDKAFSAPELQRTRTLLVLYKGHLLREQYVEGFGPDTPVLGWSMTKSILATLFGILEYQGQLDIGMTPGLEAWQGDGRSRITYENLLRMQSALEWNENYSGLSDVTRMLFLSDSMPAVQAGKRALGPPGSIWNYSSGTTNLLSGLLRRHFENDQRYLDFPYRELADRIGMHSLLIETDLSGTFVGSSYGWASTRDWARFGLLYLNRGEWNGARLFHPQWVDQVTRPTKHSGNSYGMHFWLNQGGSYPDAPKDLYMANGYQGQHVFIIPSRDLVVVRTGLAESPDFDTNGFLAALMAAFNPEP